VLWCTAALVGTLLGGGGAAAAPGAPGARADLRVTVMSPQVALDVGGTVRPLAVVVTNDGPASAEGATLSLRAPLADSGVTVTTSMPCAPVPPVNLDCPLPTLAPGASLRLTMSLAPPGPGALPPGTEVQEDADAAVRLGAAAGGPVDPDPRNDSARFLTVLRAAVPPTVPGVSGTVVDARLGTPAEGVSVVVRDSAGHSASAVTDAAGHFAAQSDPAAALVPGRLSIIASKRGHTAGSTVVTGSDGRAVTGVVLAVTPGLPGGGTALPGGDDAAGGGAPGAGGSRGADGVPAGPGAPGSAGAPGAAPAGAAPAGDGTRSSRTPWYAATPLGDRGPVGITLLLLLLAALLVTALLCAAICVDEKRTDQLAAWRRRFTPWRSREDHLEDLLR